MLSSANAGARNPVAAMTATDKILHKGVWLTVPVPSILFLPMIFPSLVLPSLVVRTFPRRHHLLCTFDFFAATGGNFLSMFIEASNNAPFAGLNIFAEFVYVS